MKKTLPEEMLNEKSKVEGGSVFRYWKEKLRKCQYHKLQYVKSESWVFIFFNRHNCCLAMEPTKVLLAVVYYQMPEKIEGSSLDREAETAAVVLNQKYQSQTRSEKRM